MSQPAKEHPILFSTEMIRAIMGGRKTQTRRILKNSEGVVKLSENNRLLTLDQWGFKCPYGKVGDILWVRETWAAEIETRPTVVLGRPAMEYYVKGYVYKADFSDKDLHPHIWKPSIHMPKEACRIRLQVTDIRVERLWDITESDAQAEGAPKAMNDMVQELYAEGFAHIWYRINGVDSWNENPWVWAITFKR